MGRIAILGASGYVGTQVVKCLLTQGHDVVAVTRRDVVQAPHLESVICDATEWTAVQHAVENADVVVNCIHATPQINDTIAQTLVSLLREDRVGRIVHLSSLAVFGQTRGVLHERSRPVPAVWHRYAVSKRRVEKLLLEDDSRSARCLVMRLGCVYGPHAPVWVDRLLRLLHAGRLGWLGDRGQGACRLVHVADVAKAVARAIVIKSSGTQHLLSPSRLSWNAYFQRLATLSGLPPLRPQGALSLAKEVWLKGSIHYGLNQIQSASRDDITPAMTRLFRNRATIVSIRPDLLEPHEFVPISVGTTEAVAASLAVQYRQQCPVLPVPGRRSVLTA